MQGLKLGAIDFIKKPFFNGWGVTKSGIHIGIYHKKAVLNMAHHTLNAKNNLPLKTGNDSFEQNCRIYQLTAREIEMWKLIRRGLKYKDIGLELFTAETKARKHAQNIFEKVEVSNKIELINRLQNCGND